MFGKEDIEKLFDQLKKEHGTSPRLGAAHTRRSPGYCPLRCCSRLRGHRLESDCTHREKQTWLLTHTHLDENTDGSIPASATGDG